MSTENYIDRPTQRAVEALAEELVDAIGLEDLIQEASASITQMADRQLARIEAASRRDDGVGRLEDGLKALREQSDDAKRLASEAAAETRAACHDLKEAIARIEQEQERLGGVAHDLVERTSRMEQQQEAVARRSENSARRLRWHMVGYACATLVAFGLLLLGRLTR